MEQESPQAVPTFARKFDKLALFHPVFLAVYLMLFLFSYNKEQLQFGNIILPLLLTLLFVGGVYLVTFAFIKHKQTSALIASLSLIFFFAYGTAYAPIEYLKIGDVIVGRFRYFFPAWSLLFLLIAYGIVRMRSYTKIATKFIAVVGLTLLLFPVIDIAAFTLRNNDEVSHTFTGLKSGEETIAESPDIYYLILDQYAHAETLKAAGFDNTSFINALEDRGFMVRKRSATNYPLTSTSLTSSLNMRYIEGERELEDAGRQAFRAIRDNAAQRFLKNRGYTTIHFDTGVSITEYNEFADVNISCGRVSELWALIIRMTPLKILDRRYRIVDGDHRGRILCQFERLAEVPFMEGEIPKFVFAHIVSPHAPFVFGPNGENVDTSFLGVDVEQPGGEKLYLEQLQYLNTLVLDTVTKIQERSKRPPVIIIHSDHGSSSRPREVWDNPTDEFLNERMRNFMALYAPTVDREIFAKKVTTPVNIFRFIFNEYFDANFPLLEERSYFASIKKPFIFTDVTDRLEFASPDVFPPSKR
ncbi:MAG: hypothetical protein A2849_01150 [Candidatus Taylorbacteria bacterium RIFCSPHIGHO2_01_FULL_51_15]|uniref:Sulfatase N-terminal domain-containing protein n=1 Tax=Candidatus Taylorbacteria bacterium RIFCSPHIGHO2_01_FULL_51_15 TaxID=1802304 RepID=A0A1G2M8Y1_9BACT|nr:MAG: hypothetical protein A2849_01150 [Candidatus Taylorbacteria bacterium RIFCSPHIGHO2_01_FULL_51_15]